MAHASVDYSTMAQAATNSAVGIDSCIAFGLRLGGCCVHDGLRLGSSIVDALLRRGPHSALFVLTTSLGTQRPDDIELLAIAVDLAGRAFMVQGDWGAQSMTTFPNKANNEQ